MKRMLSVICMALLCMALLLSAAMAEDVMRTVTFHVNNGETDAITQEVKDGKRLTATPDTGDREGYVFLDWYTDEACTQKFEMSTKITADIDLYGAWMAVTVFEAEDLDVSALSGPGYSGSSSRRSMIIENYDCNASNDHFISYLYADYNNTMYNTTLEFHVTSDKAVSGVRLYVRMSAEYQDITINGDLYEILVNGVKLGYDDITFTGALDATLAREVLPFEDYLISLGINLNEGDNIITLRTANGIKQGDGGTMKSTAPMVDCIKLASTEGTFEWTEGFYSEDNYE